MIATYFKSDFLKNNNIKIDPKSTKTKQKVNKVDKTIYTKFVEIQPIGYPFDFNLMEDDLEINDIVLFEEYAREQWLGLTVKEGAFLFDQKIIPDYGFKILTAKPNDSVISENTIIKLVEKKIKTKKQVKSVKTNIKFDDIVGHENAKNKSKILMKYIEDPEKFGQWAPKNILFYGLPGTGKTMLAKAIANELEVPLYLIKATSLIGDYVGDGASKIHELFEKATKNSPSLIFIDEIDAIALHRSFQSLRGDVSEIVNALLTEMDGIFENKAVITIGATNNLNSLDYAVRSRFEEELEFKLPTDEERLAILESHLRTYPLESNLNLKELVKITKDMSGRDIKEKILKTALHHAIIKDKNIVDMQDVEYAMKQSKIVKLEVKGMYE